MERILIASFVLAFTTLSARAQGLPEDTLQEVFGEYQSKINNAVVLKDCGHALDGPAYITKQLENNWLDFMLYVTPEARTKVGRQTYKKYLLSGKIDNKNGAYPKAQEILKNLVKYADRKNVSYQLNILDSEDINAFATLGGYLYITKGLINFVDSYDELAFIIGHEIAHEDKLHTQRKITKLTLSTNLMNMTKMQGFNEIAQKINGTLSAPFDQIDEYESDSFGFEMAKKAGYDVNRFADFFKKLEKYEKQDLLEKLTRTHPFSEHRKNCIERYIKN
ncbi:M48 family metallopeptidase [Costertonia aggregata]|uniref:M48 family metalloprotease n=1 Tax=Costertonia aggregata TaxID=343403 RepID=A0A7H9AP83_9FLAO|nr:M48 family metallopeptidase [Costertonia aggregata]QLG45075.1 M48 family metalloprotease [Costertonia aggregata]